MPIYSYTCKNCGMSFDFLILKRSEKPACPMCKSMDIEKQMTAASIIAPGSDGKTGATCCGKDERCVTPPCSNTGTCKRD